MLAKDFAARSDLPPFEPNQHFEARWASGNRDVNFMGRSDCQPAKRVRALTGTLVDDCIQDAEWSELQSHLTVCVDGRRAHVEAIQLSTALYYVSAELE